MKILTVIIAAVMLASCSSTPFKERTKEDQETLVKINVMDYCTAKMKESDLAVNNFMLAYKRERVGVKADKLSPFDDLKIVGDTAEVTLMLANSYKSYAKNAQGHPAYSTGIHFKIDGEGKVLSHTGYLLYYGDNEPYISLTGDNANLLYNSFKSQ